MHDNGGKHKGNVQKYLRKIDKDSKEKDDAKEKLRTELDRIEKAAALRYSKDTGVPADSVKALPSKSSNDNDATKPSNPAGASTKKVKETIHRPDNIGIVGAWEVVEETEAVDTAAAAPAIDNTSSKTSSKRAHSPSQENTLSTTAHLKGSDLLDDEHADSQDHNTFEIKEKTIGSVYNASSSQKQAGTSSLETTAYPASIQFKKRRTASNRDTTRKQRKPL
ncbi:hypothetical protein GGI05_004612 [Coemansia sp. RSA 2603]|nr:hypothetical protein GGI05_004612 [Coemansia sp. RSA 2603]